MKKKKKKKGFIQVNSNDPYFDTDAFSFIFFFLSFVVKLTNRSGPKQRHTKIT